MKSHSVASSIQAGGCSDFIGRSAVIKTHLKMTDFPRSKTVEMCRVIMKLLLKIQYVKISAVTC